MNQISLAEHSLGGRISAVLESRGASCDFQCHRMNRINDLVHKKTVADKVFTDELPRMQDTRKTERGAGCDTGREGWIVSVKLKRVYASPSHDDGYRVLVDRLWPRGIAKADAQVDDWLKSVAPSAELRKWFHEDGSRWAEFRRRYLAELTQHRDGLRSLAKKAGKESVTLVYSAKNESHNNAVVLKQYLKMLGAD